MNYRTRGTPTHHDPIGGRGEGSPEWIPCRLVVDHGDGTADVLVESFGAQTVLERVTEGTEPGQITNRSGMRRLEARQVRAGARALLNDPKTPAMLRIALRVLLAATRDGMSRADATALRDVIADSGAAPAERAVAALGLALLVRDDERGNA